MSRHNLSYYVITINDIIMRLSERGRCSPPYFVTHMCTILPFNIDWSQELQYPWTSNEGQACLNNLVTPFLPFSPRPFQIYDSACILTGQDVFCISAMGDGYSSN